MNTATTHQPPGNRENIGPVVMAINEAYTFPAACMLYSLGISSPGLDRVIILGSNISAEATKKLAKVAIEVNLEVESRDSSAGLRMLGDVPVSGHVSKDAWTRLLIPAECSDDETCLYVDADMQCRKGFSENDDDLEGLDQLFRQDLGDNIVGATRDVFERTFKLPEDRAAEKTSANSRGAPYFNSGLLLINCVKWREEEITDKAASFARKHPEHIRYWDQDALNIVLHRRWQELDQRWNMAPVSDLLNSPIATTLLGKLIASGSSAKDLIHSETAANNMHFITPLKPWLPGYPQSHHWASYQGILQTVRKIAT